MIFKDKNCRIFNIKTEKASSYKVQLTKYSRINVTAALFYSLVQYFECCQHELFEMKEDA